MKLPLIAVCLAAGSTWTFAFADDTAAVNPKTGTKTFVAPRTASGPQGKMVFTSKTSAPAPATELSPEQRLKLDPKANTAQKLAQIKRAAQSQSFLTGSQGTMGTQGLTPANPRGVPGILALNGSDDCSTADLISGVGAYAFDTNAATTGPQQGLNCGGGSAYNDVWFNWTCPTTGVCTWTLCFQAGYDTLVAVYTPAGCPSPGSAIACDDDSSCGLESTLQFACVAGQNYMLQLGAYSSFGFGSGTFTLNVSIPPPNDNCSTPSVIAGTGTFNFDNTVASTGTDGQNEALCAAQYGQFTVDNDIWYQWTAPSSGVAQVTTCGLTSTDTKIAAYAGTGCPAPGSAIGCRDDSCQSYQTNMLFPVTAGQTYTIQMGTFPGAQGGIGQFSLNVLQPPANDGCTTPTILGGSGVFPFDNTIASTGTDGQSESLCAAQYGQFTVDSDIWFRWTAPSTGIAVVDTCGLTSVDTKIAVYGGTGCPAPGSALACLDDACQSGLQTTMLVPVTAGQTYTIQLGTFPGADGGAGSLSLSVVQPPPNDNCTTPTAIAGLGSFPFDNQVASTGTQGQNEALCNFYGMTTIDHDIWYTWTAPSSGCTVLDTCGNNVDTKIAVYPGTGCPSPNSSIGCNDDACGLQTEVRFTATAGQTYLIQFGTFPNAQGGVGTFNIAQLGAGAGNDNCATPTVIAGLGVFPFDNSPGVATTGCEGQNEAACAVQYFGQVQMQNDVWFQWTAPTTGFAVADTCGLTSVDTKIGAYQGTGCPAPGSALACTDDSCPGFQTTLVWPCTAGTTYTIQMATFPGATGGPGNFSLNVVLPPTNDDCTSPVVLAPAGPYPFALLGASTGAQGQNEALCNFYGMTAVENDIWFTWTAPSTARANLTFCFGSSFDSKAAVYNGAGCPVGSAIACNDDACGLTTEMCFDVTGGNTYTIQVGTFPGAGNNFVGSFDIFLLPPNPPCTLDDGTTENLLVWVVGGDMVWLNAFGTAGGNTTLSSVDVMWGSAMFPGYNPASNGDFATDIFIWQDGPSQDQDPSDASLLLTIPTTVTVWDSDTYVSFPIAPLAISGTFFVGCHQDSYGISGAGPTQYVAPMDQNCPASGVAWFFGNNSGFGTSPVDYNNPANNVQPPVLFQNIGLPCQVAVRAGCNAGPATYLCDPGSGPTIACPCANPPSGSGRGCNNSSGTGGASISGSGNNSLGTPTLVFTTAGERPTATSILLQGTAVNTTGINFGQGVRCTAGVLKRLYVKTAVGGSIIAPNLGGGDLPIPARSAVLGDPISAGQNRWYSVYYRDPNVLGGCSVLATFNTTNTAQVLWQP